jgi:hypothetical protein
MSWQASGEEEERRAAEGEDREAERCVVARMGERQMESDYLSL